MTFPRAIAPKEAALRARSLVGRGTYVLGAGGYHPIHIGDVDLPWTPHEGIDDACDCWGFAGSWCLKLPRHVPGFNRGAWATVSDDANCDSAIEDAEHVRQMFTVAKVPQVGDLLVFPSIRDPITKKRLRIGHVGIVVTVRALEWDVKAPAYDLLDVAQCRVARPAIGVTNGAGWLWRDVYRGQKNPAWRSRLVRPVLGLAA